MRMTQIVGLLTLAAAAMGQEGPAIPWEEFKSLYHERVERDLREALNAAAKEEQVATVSEAHYTLTLGETETRGEVLVSGEVVSGGPAPIPLFGSEFILTEVAKLSGGTLLCEQEEKTVRFLPAAGATEFQLLASFLVRPAEKDGAHSVSFAIPAAPQNSLALTLPEGTRLLEAPGVRDEQGTYHFGASAHLSVRYVPKLAEGVAALLEYDGLTRVSVQQNRVLVAAHFAAVRGSAERLRVHAPADAQLISSSLRSNAVKPLGEGVYEVDVPGEKEAFSLEFVLAAPQDGAALSLRLPAIENNAGEQGRFVIEEPENGEVTVTGEGLVGQLPVERLGATLAQYIPEHQYYTNIPGGQPITLVIRQFASLSTAATVLDCQYVFTSFDENGTVLTTLVMEVPPETGPRLTLKPVAGAEIWALQVNGARKEVFLGDSGAWVVPLESGQPSHVELSFLRRGEKLGLQGRLEAAVPETGLPARQLRLGIALPERVELLYLEGPVNPTTNEGWILPAEFLGKPYFFAQSFYQGEAATAAISYKEPVKQ
ncbi:MAG: hypothetical protein HYZ00_00085 [Candidatus Hydrogenedentes bacterium]|nr:hypothetical protein [Candidatus Hydrogenedentota bacterium]